QVLGQDLIGYPPTESEGWKERDTSADRSKKATPCGRRALLRSGFGDLWGRVRVERWGCFPVVHSNYLDAERALSLHSSVFFQNAIVSGGDHSVGPRKPWDQYKCRPRGLS